jgi:hypothetical protein
MGTNPIERNPVTRFLLGVAVVAAMTAGGGAAGWLLDSAGAPAGEYVGVAVGASVVFVAFTVWYRRYDASAR